jgi:hypothetical protein
MYVVFATSTRSTSVETTIYTFFMLMKRERWGGIWSHLSPELCFLLSDEERDVLADRGPLGVDQIKRLAHTYEELFKESCPQVISKHRVPDAPEGAEMVMIHTRHKPSGHGVTFWLVRKRHSQGYWMIEEVLVHPTAQTRLYMLTGKRFVVPKAQDEVESTSDARPDLSSTTETATATATAIATAAATATSEASLSAPSEAHVESGFNLSIKTPAA